MTCPPYNDARRVFWIVDNGSSIAVSPPFSASSRSIRAFLVHGPVHASWLNQIEIYFSVIQRKVLTPNDFPTDATPNAFSTFNTTGRLSPPFQWRFTRQDLARLLRNAAPPSKPPPKIRGALMKRRTKVCDFAYESARPAAII